MAGVRFYFLYYGIDLYLLSFRGELVFYLDRWVVTSRQMVGGPDAAGGSPGGYGVLCFSLSFGISDRIAIVTQKLGFLVFSFLFYVIKSRS